MLLQQVQLLIPACSSKRDSEKAKRGVREGGGDSDERELRRSVVKKELTEWRWFVVGGGCWRWLLEKGVVEKE
jgi:hypothetical protein